MGHFAFALFFGLLAIAATAQTTAPKLTDFAGTWKAEFKKETWLTLTLERVTVVTDARYRGEVLSGTLTHSMYLSSDNEGDITSVGDEMSKALITKATLEGNVLHLVTKDEEGDEDGYDLTLTGPNSADLKPLSSDGSPTPKAFILKRVVPTVPNPQK